MLYEDLLFSATGTGLSSIAARLGYYDQAHLTHDFVEFAGEPPRQFIDSRTA